MHPFKIDIQIQAQYQNTNLKKLLRQVARSALSNFFPNNKKVSLDIIIASNTILHNLNKEFMAENSATDVLAFPAKYSKSDPSHSFHSKNQFLYPNSSHVYLGEVYLSYPQAKKQAKHHHHTVDVEITTLIVHGILHILGFDHLSIKENFEMEQATKFLLNKMYKG